MGGASRPARPRRLEAGAARISPYRVKLLRFMGNPLTGTLTNTLFSVLARDRVESAYLTYECVRVWVVSKDTGVWTMDSEYVLGSARCYRLLDPRLLSKV